MNKTKDEKTFSDLEFEKHNVVDDAVQARLDLGNDIEISVVAMKGKETEFGGLYGSVLAGTYEVAVFQGNTMQPLSPWDDVIGWQTEDEVTELMTNLQGKQDDISAFIEQLHLKRSESRAELELDN